MTEPLLHVVLYRPDIPQNAGNVGRTCAAVGAKLWLVRPLGFRLDAKPLRRAGLDYWDALDWEAVGSLEELRAKFGDYREWRLTKRAERTVWQAEFAPRDVLLFGSETQGLPPRILDERPERNLRLPMQPEVRSLNLASAATAVIYEAVRQFGGLPETGNDDDG